MNQNLLLQAYEHYQAGRMEPAAELLRQNLTMFASDPAANHLLGGIYYKQGRLAASRDHIQRACSTPGATAEMFNNLGATLKAMGDARGAIAAFQRALALEPDHAVALNNLAVMYRDQGDPRRSIEILRRVASLNPDLPEAQENLRNAYNDVVPAWHFAMVSDRPRNDSYQAAIARAAPGKRVLDIGAGTGLLAMMAAKAGANTVTSCEATAVIAETARAIIALNGLAHRIDVIAKHSTALTAGRDLQQRAELLVTEIFSSDLLSEGILPAVEHAHRELLTPQAVVMPRIAEARAYLAGGGDLQAMLFAGRSNGFDLSPFNVFAPPRLAVCMNNVAHDVLSDDVRLFSFNLHAKLFAMGSDTLSVPITRSGVAAALVQWIRLELDANSDYENRPSSGPEAEMHWTHIVYRFPRPLAVMQGENVQLQIGHNREKIWVRPVK